MLCNAFQSDSACVAILEPPLKVCTRTRSNWICTHQLWPEQLLRFGSMRDSSRKCFLSAITQSLSP